MKQSLLSIKILQWYDFNKRDLPWRSVKATPYHIWLSEIMLQQTTVAAVVPYFFRFLKKWPTLEGLAKADLDEILVLWQGLGYYSRAKNLFKCAQTIIRDYQGEFPNCFITLKSLPGIGEYTAAAICAIAFDMPETVVDGNVVRILSRLYAINSPYPSSKALIMGYARDLTPVKRPGDYVQGLMDLGATICKPLNPLCSSCPLSCQCKAFKSGNPSQFPFKNSKPLKPVRYMSAFIIENLFGQIFIRKRKESGLLSGMMEVFSTPWTTVPVEVISHDLFDSKHILIPPHFIGEINHTFTHFHLKVKIFKTKLDQFLDGTWAYPQDLSNYALPTLMKKIIKKGYQDVSI